jgi:3-oxoacyl-[acyl-carrier protein] reductase
MRIADAQVIVTGAASGIGYHFVVRLAGAGASVVAADSNTEGLQQLVARCRSYPGKVVAVPVDVSAEPQVAQFGEEALRHLPRVDVLVNCAGILADGVLLHPEDGWTKRMPMAQWRRVLDTNLSGTFLMTREIASAMIPPKGHGGLIVNISSLARSGNAGQSAYAASKAGMDAATRSWAIELAPFGIRVASIAPGVIDTPMLANITDEAKHRLLNRVPLGRFGTVDEIWLALEFVIQCEYFTGRVLEVDGGAAF